MSVGLPRYHGLTTAYHALTGSRCRARSRAGGEIKSCRTLRDEQQHDRDAGSTGCQDKKSECANCLRKCRSLELRCTCDLLRAYLPMTRNTSATSIKHDHPLRWGGQMYYHEKARNDN